MKIKSLLVLSLIFTFICCSEKTDETGMNVFQAIEVKDNPDNILRKTISFNTTEKSSCSISYWRNEDKSDMRTSRTSPAAKRHDIMLIMMKENSTYHFQITDDKQHRSETREFRTGSLDKEMKEYFITDAEDKRDFLFGGFILYANKTADYMLMIDNQAEIVWYERFAPDCCSAISYDAHTQTISFMHGKGELKPCGSNLSCIDLYGNRLLEANIGNLTHNEMHHDLYRMQDGNWIYTNFVHRDYDFSSLGLDEIKTVTGDRLTIINDKNEILWEWTCFDHLDPLKDPNILKVEKRPVIDDWMHTNSIVEDKEGNIYISCNKMKQFMKIDRKTGNVIYRLGYNGNIDIEDSVKPDRLHSLEILENGEIMLFENGDRDREYSRVLSYRVDEKNRKAEALTCIMLPLHLRSHYNSNAYRLDENHLIVHSTANQNTAIMDRQGKILWTSSQKGLSFRAIYIPDGQF